MPSVTRRETFGLGLAGGLAVTFVSGSAKPADAAPPPPPTFTIVHVNDIYRMGDVKGPRRFPEACSGGEGGTGARRADPVHTTAATLCRPR